MNINQKYYFKLVFFNTLYLYIYNMQVYCEHKVPTDSLLL